MSNHVTFQFCIMLAVALIVTQGVEAGHSQDRNRVLYNYNLNNDLCVKLPNFTSLELKEAADSACEQAFHALDRLKANLCEGWLEAACRQLPGFPHHQCTCMISSNTSTEIRSNDVSSFRNCAWKFYHDEIHANRIPIPSVDFQHTYEKIYHDAKQTSKRLRLTLGPFEEGPSYVPVSRPYSGYGSMQGGSTSYLADMRSLEGASRSAGPSGAGPSGAGPSGAGPSGSGPSSTGPSGSGPSGNPVIASASTRYLHVCRDCGRRYKTKQNLKDHRKSHEKDLRCPICNGTFCTQGNLNYHMKHSHPNPADISSGSSINPDSNQDAPKPFVCDVCGRGYVWRSSWYSHKKTHKVDARCSDCNVSCSKKGNLRKHMRDSHPEAYKAEIAEENARRMVVRQHECEICKERFISKKMLQLHMPFHRGETHCHLCNMTFPRKADLTQHNKKEHNN